jgi:hypothetical protein
MNEGSPFHASLLHVCIVSHAAIRGLLRYGRERVNCASAGLCVYMKGLLRGVDKKQQICKLELKSLDLGR